MESTDVETLTCGCGADNDAAEMFCRECGNVLTAAPAPGPAAPHDDRGADPAPPRPALTQCPHCDADVPDPANLACVECLRPFPVPAAPPRADDARDAATGLRLRLAFSARGDDLGVVELAAGEELLVGRQAGSPCADLVARWDNVSRRHAVIGLDGDGAAWVRDEYSVNGTAVNGVAVPPGRRSVVQDGDRLGFGADVVAAVTGVR